MRSVILMIMCGACGGVGSPSTSDAAPSSFTFEADYVLDATVTSAYVGSASYSTGQTIHVDLEFASYAASQGSGLAVLVVAGSESGAFAITPNCPVGCTDASHEMLEAEIGWQGRVIETDVSGSCVSAADGCGWAE
ncbi:MAG TPA: hypothetical protein VGL61_09555 [Kofleriaceae bacterium]